MTNQFTLSKISQSAKQVIKKAVDPLLECFMQLDIPTPIVIPIIRIENGIGILRAATPTHFISASSLKNCHGHS
jgi:hypothetical protein